MKIYTFGLLIFLFLGSCSSKTNSEDQEKELELEINFYPSSGGKAVYEITLSGNTLTINKLRHQKYEFSTFKKSLSKIEIQDLKSLLDNLYQRSNVDASVVLDSWRAEVIYNGVIYYNQSDIRLNSLPPDVKAIISFLLKDSTIGIDLFGFA